MNPPIQYLQYILGRLIPGYIEREKKREKNNILDSSVKNPQSPKGWGFDVPQVPSLRPLSVVGWPHFISLMTKVMFGRATHPAASTAGGSTSGAVSSLFVAN
jgi:hypothetical protein